MACFLVPTAEAIVTTIASKVIEKKENSPEEAKKHSENTENAGSLHVPFSRKLKWLNNMPVNMTTLFCCAMSATWV